MVCYNEDNLNTIYEYTTSTNSNQVIGAYIDTTDNPVYGEDVTQISTYIYAESTATGGVFALGVWDSSGNLKNESATFTTSNLASGTTPAVPTQVITKSITSTTIAEHDSIGIICKTAIGGSGQVANGGYDKGSAIADWKRTVFIQGSSPAIQANRVLPICVSNVPPSVATTFLPPPPITVRF